MMNGCNWLKDIKAVGFDVDGTLYKSNAQLNEWFNQRLISLVAEKVGKKVQETWPEFLRRKQEFGSTTLTLNSFGLDGEKIFQQLFDIAPIERFVIPDVRLHDLMDELDLEYRLFIVSNGTRRQIERKLRLLGINPGMFDPLVACYDEGDIKPHPGPFLKALDVLDLAPIEVLYVGDREDTDIQGAKGAEMKACLVWGKSEKADLSLGNIYSLREVLL